MKIDTDFLCDLWMKLSQLSNREDIEDEECTALVDLMDEVEIALMLKLQDEVPNAFKVLAIQNCLRVLILG
ncbi:putative prophage protein [Bartonella ancashensis]|uniref:Putative prophage protein n=1 Tax=Bartonella ancashensis TaxID=1318743 RepID=A0A0M4L6W9_9HYPH|nr:putative prophage protein [Bartonella ancashensis]